MEIIKKNLWHTVFLIFALSLLAFGLKRAQYPMRWSGWSDEAKTLNSGMHFAREGFITHYFLAYWHPGFLGKSYGSDSPMGYYTRYTPLPQIIDGFLFSRFGENRAILKSVAVCFSIVALFFCYLVFLHFFNSRIAFFSVAFIGTSVGFLQFMDCLSAYAFAEFFRFSTLFFFLLLASTENGVRRILFWIKLAVVWMLLFLDSYNALDYIIFLQLFIWLYYLLSARKLPFGRLLFFAGAPVCGFVLHQIQSFLALRHYGLSASSSLLKNFEEKTLPFHKGVLHILSFLTYFARTMEGHMVNANFGFGFGALFLMLGGFLLLSHLQDESSGFPGKNRGFSIGKVLILFAVPSVSWWLVFPNQSASFFNTPMHAFPIIGLIFGCCLDACLRMIENPAGRSLKVGSAFILAGCLWSPLIFTGKYVKEYPNLLDPQHRIYNNDFNGLSTKEIEKLTELSSRLKEKTAYGDIILVPLQFKNVEEFYGYYCQRRMDYCGETPAYLNFKLEELREYRKEGAKRYKIFNPDLKIYALRDLGDNSPITAHLISKYKSSLIEGSWAIFDLDFPK